MSKPRQQSSGFTNAPKSQPSRKKPAQSSADHSNKEHQAVALINQGKLQEAEAIYRKLISAGTSNHIVYGNLAALCGMQGRFDELIKLLRQALQLKPNYPEAHNNLSFALQEQGDLPAAIASYNTALQLIAAIVFGITNEKIADPLIFSPISKTDSIPQLSQSRPPE